MDAKIKSATEANTEVIDLTDRIDHRERFMDEQYNCPLCGSSMLITHVTHFVEMRVREQAECESCRIKVRDLKHQLQ